MKNMELVRTAVSKKYGEFKYYIEFNPVYHGGTWLMWQESTPFENDHRFGGVAISAKSHDEAVEYIKGLKYGYVGAIKTVIH